MRVKLSSQDGTCIKAELIPENDADSAIIELVVKWKVSYHYLGIQSTSSMTGWSHRYAVEFDKEKQ